MQELFFPAPTMVKVCLCVLQVTVYSSGGTRGQLSVDRHDVPFYGVVQHLCLDFHENLLQSNGEEAFEHVQLSPRGHPALPSLVMAPGCPAWPRVSSRQGRVLIQCWHLLDYTSLLEVFCLREVLEIAFVFSRPCYLVAFHCYIQNLVSITPNQHTKVSSMKFVPGCATRGYFPPVLSAICFFSHYFLFPFHIFCCFDT